MNYLAATITGQTFHYEGPLTFDQVYTYRHTVCMWSCNPTYLFLTEEGALDLATEATGIENTSREASEQKAEVTPLRALFGMHIVILPTLPANTLIIGKFEINRPTPEPAHNTNKYTLNLPTRITGFLELPSPTPSGDTMNEQVAMITRHINEQPRLTRDQIESVSEQAIQHMKDKQIKLDWDEV